MNFWSEQVLFYLSLLLILILPGWFLLNAVFLLSSKSDWLENYTQSKGKVDLLEKVPIAIGLSVIIVNFLLIGMNKLHILIDAKNVLLVVIFFIFVCWLLSRRVSFIKNEEDKKENDQRIKNTKILTATLALLFLGPLWALSSPQTKFVSGGVVGNVLGNLFISMALYFYLRAFQEKNHNFMVLALFSTVGMFYTHHLSSFIFLFIIIFTLLAYFIFFIITYFWPKKKWFKVVSENSVSSVSLDKLMPKNNNIKKDWNFEKFKSRFSFDQHLLNTFLIVLVLFLTIFIRSIYLEKTVFPTATDLGHHLYWSDQIATTGQISSYQKQNIIQENNRYILQEKPIADFIIGEHLIFTAIHLISGISFISYFPSLVLFFVNLVTLLMIFSLVYRLLPNKNWFILYKNKDKDNDENSGSLKLIPYSYARKIKDYLGLVFNFKVIFFLILVGLFAYFVYLPAYLQIHAVDTVVGAPSKATRAGLSWTEIKYFLSEPRLALALVGFLIISILTFSRRFPLLSSGLLAGWATSLFLMIWKPQWLHINIPSGRISTYLIFPISLLAALGFVSVFFNKKKKDSLLLLAGYLFLSALFFYGMMDNVNVLRNTKNNKNQLALATFHSARYLDSRLRDKNEVNILKDHNYLVADTWMKLFFHQDYNYPLSRGYFKRYNDKTKSREHCTLWMITEPDSSQAQQCFNDLKIKYIIVNPNYDAQQFEKSSQFWKIYSNKEIAIYYKYK